MIHYLTDFLLERKIRKAKEAFLSTRTHVDLDKLFQLIRQRSPQQIARMEREKGLA